MKYAHAHAIAAAIEAVDEMQRDAGFKSLRDDRPGGFGRLAGVAGSARASLVDLLITAKVWTDDEVAGGVLDAD